jgi:DNA polymerase-4
VVGGDPDGRGVVATASYEARAFGVHSGMALRTAKRLAPAAIFVPGNYSEYARVSRAFHSILGDFSPLVEPGGLDEAYIDLTGCEAIAGPPLAAAAGIRGRVRAELGIAASVGIAGSKLVAKVASDHAKPDGVCLVAEGGEAAFLAPMPLRALPMLGPSLERRLAGLGLTTLGQLAALPASTLTSLLGRQGPLIGLRARGIDPSPVGRDGEAKSISREGTFASDVVDDEHLRSVLRGFSESVGSQLRRSGRRARTVTLKLRFQDFTTISRSLTLRRPLNSDAAIFEAAATLLDRARLRDRRPVRLIGTGVSNLVDDASQLRLQPAVEDREEWLSATFDQVRRRFGARSLQTGRTAFDRATSAASWPAEKSQGLSSQLK